MGTVHDMEVFEYEVHALALESREAALDGDPMGPFHLERLYGWVVRPN